MKLLVDAIQSSKFITQTKSRELIGKIKGFVSEYQGKTLQRQVFIDDREMDRTYYSSMENGSRNVSIRNIEKIATGFGITIEELMRGV